MALEKMDTKNQAMVRSNFYSRIEESFSDYTTEPISDGLLIHLEGGHFAKVKVSVCDATKFDLEKERTAYAEKCAKAAERAEKARQKAEERAEKAAEKAAKAAEKAV